MKKRMLIMLICLAILFGAIFGWKAFYNHKRGEIAKQRLANRLITVSAMQAKNESWQPKLTAVGSTRTYKGVYVTTELGGMITKVDFKPGAIVKKGQLLAQLDIAPDLAKLHALEADARFADITYHRNLKQYRIGAVSKETLASDKAQYESTAANVNQEKAIIAKKTIRAPFAGRLGIALVYPGQYINPGDKVVNLETLSPIYVDFYLPQQDLTEIEVGMPVSVSVDTYAKKVFQGKITTINPLVDQSVRNVEVEATLPNTKHLLLPGMFTNVSFKVGKAQQLLTLPATAISFNPYGDVAFLLTKTDKQVKGQTIWQARQEFVTTGDPRGNQISVLSGIQKGEWVVTSGQIKLHNGSHVVVNNKLQPSDSPNPQLKQGE